MNFIIHNNNGNDYDNNNNNYNRNSNNSNNNNDINYISNNIVTDIFTLPAGMGFRTNSD